MCLNKNFFTILLFFAFCASSILLSSCSDDDNINTATATVSMGESTYSIKENKGIFTIPVLVSGEQNGDIKVEVAVAAEGQNCVENKHFIVTSNNVVIPSSKKSVNIEIKAIDDRVINEDRKFKVTIVKAEGASISEQNKSTLVTLMDNDDIPYERMAGKWTVVAYVEDPTSTDNPETTTWETEITSVDEGEEGYGVDLFMSPWVQADYTMLSHGMRFAYNTSSETATVTLPLGTTMAEGLDFGKDDLGNDFSVSSVVSATIGMSIVTSGQVVGEVNSDFTRIVFSMPIAGMIYNENGQTMQSVVGSATFFSPMFIYYKMELTLNE